MANAGCINAIGFDGTYLRTLDTLDSANIGVGVQYCIPAPLDDKRLDYIKYTDKCGCTCCITGENEILVYATNGVIKNFTLTNDDTNEVVKVKWNDLFGSNRAYTMVRYKTGSYPTSITDGTLAVKETTQNQYSVSGYNVSGLTDGTTYYFTAFAVSQDGTIIVVQTNSITTDFGRKPDSNTVMYFPFVDNQSDEIGNASISATGTKDTLGFRFSQSGKMLVNTPPTNCRFVAVRVRRNASKGSYNQTPSTYIGRILYNFQHGQSNYNRKFEYNQSNGLNIMSAQQNTSMGIWYHFAMGYDGTTVRAYLNGTKVREQSSSGAKDMGNMRFGYDIDMNVSQYIGQKQVRSDSEVSEYVNKTKSKYGY